MTPPQIISLILAIVLFLPGACFAVFGTAFTLGPDGSIGGLPLLLIGAAILAAVFFLARFAIRRDGR